VDQAIIACGDDAHEAIEAHIVTNQLLETDLEKLRAAVSMGYPQENYLSFLRSSRVVASIGTIKA
jgi:hypothetical protein